MPSFSFDPKTNEAKLAPNTTISAISIKNVTDVKSHEVKKEDDGTLVHTIHFNTGGKATVTLKGNQLSYNGEKCTTTVSDDPNLPNAVILIIS